MPKRPRCLTTRQRTRGIQDQSPEADDAHVGRSQMFNGPIGDQPLAVLDARVLLRHTVYTRVVFVSLLGTVDKIVVLAPAEGNVVRIHLRMHTRTPSETIPLGVAQRPVRIPGVVVNPARRVVDRYPALAMVVLAGESIRGQAMVRHQKLADAPVVLAGIAPP